MRPRRALFLSVFCAVAVCAPGVFAQEPGAQERPSLADSLSGAAKTAYEAGRVLLNNSDPARAFEKYAQAYELSKDARLLYNMAVCARDLHQYARVQALLTRYEREAGTDLTPEEKTVVDEALAAVRILVGGVRVEANEPGASVAIDGEAIGTTPLREPAVLDLGKHTLSVTKAGFHDFVAVLDVAGGEESTVAVAMRTSRGRLVVRATAGATVIVDRQQVAQGSFDAVVPAGTHDVRITAPGKKSYAASVAVNEGETRSLQPTLADESRPAPAWPWIAGGVVVAAGAAVTTYVLLQPHDAHQGLTGTFATVDLPPAGR
jgi:hypothetical protein